MILWVWLSLKQVSTWNNIWSECLGTFWNTQPSQRVEWQSDLLYLTPGISCRRIHIIEDQGSGRTYTDLAVPLHLHTWLMPLQLECTCRCGTQLYSMFYQSLVDSRGAPAHRHLPGEIPISRSRRSGRQCGDAKAGGHWENAMNLTMDSSGSFTWGARQGFSHWCSLRHPHDILRSALHTCAFKTC